jgi:hypothetical protein
MNKMSLSKEQLAEWAQREVAYYADAEKWKRVEERMKRENDEQIAEWKCKDERRQNITKSWEKNERDQEEIKKYTQEEIKEAIHQIRIDRLKYILEPYV